MTGAQPRRRRRRRSLADLAMRSPRFVYDWMYRRGAPWEIGARTELVELVSSGAIHPADPGPTAIDLGCGSGANAIFLAEAGFEVVGVDISGVALEKARRAASHAGVAPDFVQADLLDLPASLGGPFDLLVDYGTIDDFPPRSRPGVARAVTSLARPGSVLIMWCFYSPDADLPRFSLKGASRWGAPAIEPRELTELYGSEWDIDRLRGSPGEGFGCFRLTRD